MHFTLCKEVDLSTYRNSIAGLRELTQLWSRPEVSWVNPLSLALITFLSLGSVSSVMVTASRVDGATRSTCGQKWSEASTTVRVSF